LAVSPNKIAESAGMGIFEDFYGSLGDVEVGQAAEDGVED